MRTKVQCNLNMADMTYKKFQKQENSMKSLKSFSLYLHAMTSDGKNTNHKRIPTKRKDLLAPTGALMTQCKINGTV